jgi:uncharacterized protein YuzE
MKLSIDKDIDALYITFNDNKVAETIQLQRKINVDVDSDNKVVRIEVLHYSKTKYRANEILEDTAYLSLDEDSIVFYINNGIYTTAWFNLRDVTDHYTVCKHFSEGGEVEYDLVKNFIQTEVDFYMLGIKKLNDYQELLNR